MTCYDILWRTMTYYDILCEHYNHVKPYHAKCIPRVRLSGWSLKAIFLYALLSSSIVSGIVGNSMRILAARPGILGAETGYRILQIGMLVCLVWFIIYKVSHYQATIKTRKTLSFFFSLIWSSPSQRLSPMNLHTARFALGRCSLAAWSAQSVPWHIHPWSLQGMCLTTS